MSWLTRITRFLVVTVGIVVLTSLGIDATQYFEGSGSALSILTQEALESECPEGMTLINGSNLCVDIYEVSIGESCDRNQVGSAADTAINVNSPDCEPVSERDALPWTYVTYHQAANLCAKAGKRLPTNEEWYQAALGTSDGLVCNIDDTLKPTGSAEQCVSGNGVHDMIGNVWEWVAGEVVAGVYQDRTLPEEGYVIHADSAGVALETADQPETTFNQDYFWSRDEGVAVMMRGGFYGSQTDAGLYSIHADLKANFSGQAVGFRCVTERS